MDQYYINRREKRTIKKPKNIFSGIGLGIAELGMGIVEGGAGIFINPIQGGKDEGFKGVLKGTLRCTVGVFSKPMTEIACKKGST